jgi:hypothetical protein
LETKLDIVKGIKPLFFVIIIILLFYKINSQGIKDESNFYEKLVVKNYDLEFKGLVIQVNKENGDDYYNTIKVKDNYNREELYFFDYEGPNFLNHFQIGDSIIKLKSELIITIRRKGEFKKVKLKLDGYKYYDINNNPDSIIRKYLNTK